jgi:D-alanyl-D-alanine carboxypeptidase
MGVLTLASAAASATASGLDVNSAASLTVVVNKSRPLKPLTFAPAKFGSYNLAKPASDALGTMRRAMAKAGSGNLLLASGYRGFSAQQAIYTKDVRLLGLEKGQRLAAKPGYSEHQTGLAADLWADGQGCRIRICFETTKAGMWLAANSWRYGFILRYPRGATAVTGYQFEPWHFRFVGKLLATQMHNAKATVLETFFGLPAAPNYL